LDLNEGVVNVRAVIPGDTAKPVRKHKENFMSV
jgi:hypothetical protein